jgi:hypothetical protein
MYLASYFGTFLDCGPSEFSDAEGLAFSELFGFWVSAFVLKDFKRGDSKANYF